MSNVTFVAATWIYSVVENNEVNVAVSEAVGFGSIVEELAAFVMRSKDWLPELALREEDAQEATVIVEQSCSWHTASGTRPPGTLGYRT